MNNDKTELNKYLSSLELDTSQEILNTKKTTNLTQLERDISLNNNPSMNLEIANPQRLNLTHSKDLEKDSINDKINNYNFIQKKIFKENLNI